MPKFKNKRNGDVVEVSGDDKASIERLKKLDNWSQVGGSSRAQSSGGQGSGQSGSQA